MPRKKATSPAEPPEDKNLNSVPEAADPAEPPEPETPKEQDMVSPALADGPVEPEGRPSIVTAAKGLNLREGPGFGFGVLAVLENGTIVLSLDLPMGVKVPGWELVGTGGRTGWVSNRFLRSLME